MGLEPVSKFITFIYVACLGYFETYNPILPLLQLIENEALFFERCGGALLKNPQQCDQGLPHIHIAPSGLMLASVASVEARTWMPVVWSGPNSYTLYLSLSQSSDTLIQRGAVMSRKRLGNFFQRGFQILDLWVWTRYPNHWTLLPTRLIACA